MRKLNKKSKSMKKTLRAFRCGPCSCSCGSRWTKYGVAVVNWVDNSSTGG